MTFYADRCQSIFNVVYTPEKRDTIETRCDSLRNSMMDNVVEHFFPDFMEAIVEKTENIDEELGVMIDEWCYDCRNNGWWYDVTHDEDSIADAKRLMSLIESHPEITRDVMKSVWDDHIQRDAEDGDNEGWWATVNEFTNDAWNWDRVDEEFAGQIHDVCWHGYGLFDLYDILFEGVHDEIIEELRVVLMDGVDEVGDDVNIAE